MEILKIGDRITVNCKGIKEVVNATIEGFKTLPSGKELAIITTKNGNRFPVGKNQIVKVKENVIKASGKITIEKWEELNTFDEVEKRYLDCTITLTNKSGSMEELEDLFNKVVDFMENADSDIKFLRCPAQLEEQNRICYSDSFLIEYEHGSMKDIKEYIADTWKEAKKKFNIK
jgi:hypothetical protein